MTHSEIHISTQTLCLDLADMCRITQRCVYYSTQAFQRANPEIIAGARDSAFEVQTLHSDITEIAYDLLLTGRIQPGEHLHFVMSAIRISDSLQAIHNHAVDIASNTIRLWGSGGDFAGTDLSWMSDGVNRLMECCVASLIDENVEPAQIVLGTDDLEREFVNMFHDWYEATAHAERKQARYAFEIARNLGHIVHHAREIADALIFWLAGGDLESPNQQDDIRIIDHLAPAS